MSNDGKLYEELIFRYLYLQSYEIAEDDYAQPYYNELFSISKNAQIRNIKAQNKRQIDILINKKDGRKVVVECKDHSTPIDTPIIESFISKCNNLNVNQGHFYSASGFTNPAIELGKNSMGLRLFHKPINNLLYLLNEQFDRNFPQIFSCLECHNSNEALITTEHVYHVISQYGKYFQIYEGKCSNCQSIYLIDNVSYSQTKIAIYDESTSSYPIISPIIDCKYSYLIYHFGNNNFSIEYKNKPCFIIPYYMYI